MELKLSCSVSFVAALLLMSSCCWRCFPGIHPPSIPSLPLSLCLVPPSLCPVDQLLCLSPWSLASLYVWLFCLSGSVHLSVYILPCLGVSVLFHVLCVCVSVCVSVFVSALMSVCVYAYVCLVLQWKVPIAELSYLNCSLSCLLKFVIAS